MNRTFGIAAVAILSATLIAAGGTSATAGTAERVATASVVRSVINKSTVSSRYVDMSKSIASCSVGPAGGSCSITRGSTVTQTVQLALGISRGNVTGSLGLSSASSRSLTVGCTSLSMKAGQVYRAYAVGPRYKYQVKAVSMVGYLVAKTETSGVLYAFDPKPSDIHCA